MIRSAVAAALLVSCEGVRFELATIFSSGAILQRDKPLKVWGFATPGLPLFLTLAQYDDPANNTMMSATTGADGIVVFTGPAFPASTSPYDLYLSTAPFNWPSGNGSFIHYSFLYIGDVFLCSGQSNVQISIDSLSAGDTPQIFNFSGEIQEANSYEFISLFQALASVGAADPLDNFASPTQYWVPASNVSVGTFSALCWFTGRALADSGRLENVRIGLIDSSWGGTRIFSWSPPETFDACPLPPSYNATACDYPCLPGHLYNGMIAPLTVGPLPLAAVIWYQGENDRYYDPPTYYACALGQLIDSWRRHLSDPSLFWLTVQLSSWDGGAVLGDFRDMQAAVTATRNDTATAVLVDLGDAKSPKGNVHSRQKHAQGRRVAQSLLRYKYGLTDVQASGPTFLGLSASLWAAGALSANVSFTAESLGASGAVLSVASPGRPSAQSNSSRCPAELIAPTQCDWYSLRVAFANGTAAWVNATGTPVAPSGATSLLRLTTASSAGPLPEDAVVVGSRFGWNGWPVVVHTNGEGNPVVPWNVTSQ